MRTSKSCHTRVKFCGKILDHSLTEAVFKPQKQAMDKGRDFDLAPSRASHTQLVAEPHVRVQPKAIRPYLRNLLCYRYLPLPITS